MKYSFIKIIFEPLLKIEIRNCGMLLNKHYLVHLYLLLEKFSHRNRPNYCKVSMYYSSLLIQACSIRIACVNITGTDLGAQIKKGRCRLCWQSTTYLVLRDHVVVGLLKFGTRGQNSFYLQGLLLSSKLTASNMCVSSTAI